MGKTLKTQVQGPEFAGLRHARTFRFAGTEINSIVGLNQNAFKQPKPQQSPNK